MTFAEAILAALLVLSPPARPREVLPGWSETPEARAARYVSIADDVAAAVTDACSASSAPKSCQRRAASLALGLAFHESAWAPDVTACDCYRGRDGKGQRCDAGTSWTEYQMKGSRDEARMWCADRRASTREALRRAWRSMKACRKNEASEQLAAYASGRCEPAAARAKSRELWAAITKASAALPAFSLPASP